MAYQIVIGGKDVYELASIGGWRDVKKWTSSLDIKECRAVIQFVEHGISQELERLADELKSAIIGDPPSDPTVSDTIRGLIGVLENRNNEAESAFVSDGLSEKDGVENWQGNDA